MGRYNRTLAREKFLDGEIDGCIICSNCCADVGLPTVEITQKWLEENKDLVPQN